MDTEAAVARHYTHGGLEEALLAAVAAGGKNVDRLAPDDLAPVEEFHIGGREATAEVARQMALQPGMHLLDVGCGIGGPARFIARTYQCKVTGIDLTDEFVAVARALSNRVGVGDAVEFRQGSALSLPFGAGAFDAAYMLHVGMNIPDKPKLFAEVRRVLKPGAVFALYDVMRLAPGAFDYPVPWAAQPETSFVESRDDYRSGLTGAGFSLAAERDRHEMGIAYFRDSQARLGTGDPRALSIAKVMGGDAREKIANLLGAMQRGVIAPVEMFARAA